MSSLCRIWTIQFDPKSFNLLPGYDMLERSDIDNMLIFRAATSIHNKDRSVSPLTEAEEAYLIGAYPDDYRIFASIPDPKEFYKIQFGFKTDKELLETDISVTFNIKHYIEDFKTAQIYQFEKDPTFDIEDFQENFAVSYLKRVFEDVIEANDDFWIQFYADLEASILDIKVMLEEEQHAKPRRTVVVMPVAYH